MFLPVKYQHTADHKQGWAVEFLWWTAFLELQQNADTTTCACIEHPVPLWLFQFTKSGKGTGKDTRKGCRVYKTYGSAWVWLSPYCRLEGWGWEGLLHVYSPLNSQPLLRQVLPSSQNEMQSLLWCYTIWDQQILLSLINRRHFSDLHAKSGCTSTQFPVSRDQVLKISQLKWVLGTQHLRVFGLFPCAGTSSVTFRNVTSMWWLQHHQTGGATGAQLRHFSKLVILYSTQRTKWGILDFNLSLYMQIKCCIFSQVNSASIYNNRNLLLGLLNENSPRCLCFPAWAVSFQLFCALSSRMHKRFCGGKEALRKKTRMRNNC